MLKKGWRVISLNDNYCNPQNWYLFRNDVDPTGELQWLVNWLLHAEQNNERVHILAHIPSGGGCLDQWSWNYYNIMYRFRKTIAAQFTGHTHDLYYTVYYDNVNYTTPSGIMYCGPSLTPYTHENPAYRLLTVDSSSMEVLDYSIEYVDIDSSNAMGEIQIKKLYTAKTDFGMNDLSPMSWHNLTMRMKTDDKLFTNFYK